MGSSWIRDQTLTSCIGRQILYHCPPGKPSNRIFSFNLNFFFQWSQILQITLLALDSLTLKVLPVGGYVPFGYLCSCVPSSLVRNMGSGKEGFVRKDTPVLALTPAADA